MISKPNHQSVLETWGIRHTSWHVLVWPWPDIKTLNRCVFQDRSRMYDSLNMHSLESSLIDIMRAEQDPMKSKAAFSLSYLGWSVGRSEQSDRVERGGLTSCQVTRGGAGRQQAPSLPELCCFSTHQLIFSPAESLIPPPPAARLRDPTAPDPVAT